MPSVGLFEEVVPGPSDDVLVCERVDGGEVSVVLGGGDRLPTFNH